LFDIAAKKFWCQKLTFFTKQFISVYRQTALTSMIASAKCMTLLLLSASGAVGVLGDDPHPNTLTQMMIQRTLTSANVKRVDQAPAADAKGAANAAANAPANNAAANAAPAKDAAANAAPAADAPAVRGEYAKIAPFGKEDTSKELQDHAARTQDTLVDAVENAEVAEIKRAVFRALTRLRAASIKEFDTIARLETQAIDEYNDAHHYRGENPLAYLHDDEPAVGEDKYTSFH